MIYPTLLFPVLILSICPVATTVVLANIREPVDRTITLVCMCMCVCVCVCMCVCVCVWVGVVGRELIFGINLSLRVFPNFLHS